MDRLPLPSLEEIDALPAEAVPALVLQLAALQSRAACRLLGQNGTSAPAGNGGPDRLLGLAEAAQRLGVTRDWLRRRPTLPFVLKLSDGVVRYSEQGVTRFIRKHTAGS